MDVKTKSRVDQILAEWDLDEPQTQSISLNASNNTVSMTSPHTVTGTNFPNTIYTTGTGTSTPAPWFTYNPTSTSAKINLTGDEADIEVNGWSLVDAVKRIEERLGLFQPNPELEREWADLKKLGDRYRKLEQRIKDKQAVWDRLKAMPKPEA